VHALCKRFQASSNELHAAAVEIPRNFRQFTEMPDGVGIAGTYSVLSFVLVNQGAGFGR
jgi:hypothetical protein